ncbi:hypothetical protein PIB30_116822 [Stylosanthes scabra]|uniref:J domain-containing protein n=1 Tax=Stylosanthes scabra TaxID=79078 RepID=A0ABU6VQB1_9FABA|nr:hypothetical protein [Stylosanthes scabra]
MVHPDKCKHPQAKEAFGEELRAKRKKQLKNDTASKIKSLVEEGKYDQQYEKSEAFQQELKMKVRELLTEQEWRRRKMQMRISEEEGRIKKDEEEQKEMWKRKREHEEEWEGTREKRVSSWRDFMKGGKTKKGEIHPQSSRQKIPTNPMFRDQLRKVRSAITFARTQLISNLTMASREFMPAILCMGLSVSL